MMMTLLVLKSKIKNFYEKYYHVTRAIIKFIAMFFALLVVTGQLDYSDFLGQYWVLAAVSLLCAVTPDGVSIVCLLLLICGEISGVSVLLAAAVLLFISVYVLLYGRFEKRQYCIIFLVPLLTPVYIGYAVPIVAALLGSPVVLPALVMGVLLQYIIQGVNLYASASAGGTGSDEILSSLQYLIKYLMQNRMLYVSVLAFCLTFLCVYMIRRGKFKHGPQIAILVGAILLMAVEMLSNIALELEMNLVLLTVQVAVSMVIAYIIQFFHITLDYHGTKKLQFEDDEYYYYVTAVPKFKVAVVDRTVTRILPGEEEEDFDLKQELEKALREEEEEAQSDAR